MTWLVNRFLRYINFKDLYQNLLITIKIHTKKKYRSSSNCQSIYYLYCLGLTKKGPNNRFYKTIYTKKYQQIVSNEVTPVRCIYNKKKINFKSFVVYIFFSPFIFSFHYSFLRHFMKTKAKKIHQQHNEKNRRALQSTSSQETLP